MCLYVCSQASALAVEPGDHRYVGGESTGVSFGEEGAHACDGNSIGMEGAGDERVWKTDTTELLHMARLGVDNVALAFLIQCVPEFEKGASINIVHDNLVVLLGL